MWGRARRGLWSKLFALCLFISVETKGVQVGHNKHLKERRHAKALRPALSHALEEDEVGVHATALRPVLVRGLLEEETDVDVQVGIYDKLWDILKEVPTALNVPIETYLANLEQQDRNKWLTMDQLHTSCAKGPAWKGLDVKQFVDLYKKLVEYEAKIVVASLEAFTSDTGTPFLSRVAYNYLLRGGLLKRDGSSLISQHAREGQNPLTGALPQFPSLKDYENVGEYFESVSRIRTAWDARRTMTPLLEDAGIPATGDNPYYVLIPGPSASGKSYATSNYILNNLGHRSPDAVHGNMAYVVIDGGLYREVSYAWNLLRDLVQAGMCDDPSDPTTLYIGVSDQYSKIFKPVLEQSFKTKLAALAMAHSYSIVRPDTTLTLGKTLVGLSREGVVGPQTWFENEKVLADPLFAELKDAQKAGYVIWISPVVGPKSVLEVQGRTRARFEGKKYSGDAWEASMMGAKFLLGYQARLGNCRSCSFVETRAKHDQTQLILPCGTLATGFSFTKEGSVHFDIFPEADECLAGGHSISLA